MVDETDVLLDLEVPEVMPVADDLRGVDLLEEGGQLHFGGDFLITLAAFDPKLDSILCGIFHDAQEAFFCAGEVNRGFFFALMDGLELELHVLAGEMLAGLCEGDEFVRVGIDGDAAQMQDHEACAEAFREIDGLEAELHRALALLLAMGGELVAIRGGAGDLDGQRAEIVES